MPNSNYVVLLKKSFTPTCRSCITRPFAEILCDLNKRILDIIINTSSNSWIPLFISWSIWSWFDDDATMCRYHADMMYGKKEPHFHQFRISKFSIIIVIKILNSNCFISLISNNNNNYNITITITKLITIRKWIIIIITIHWVPLSYSINNPLTSPPFFSLFSIMLCCVLPH